MTLNLDPIQALLYYEMDDIMDIYKLQVKTGIDSADLRNLLEVYLQDPHDSFRNIQRYLTGPYGTSIGVDQDDVSDMAYQVKETFDDAAAILDIRLDWRDWS